jgi:hypothetical protein
MLADHRASFYAWRSTFPEPKKSSLRRRAVRARIAAFEEVSMRGGCALAGILLLTTACSQSGGERAPLPATEGGRATVLYQDRVVEIARTLSDPNDLWVTPPDLPRINGFELKPEGACLEELCIPVRQDRDSEIFVTRAGQGWFSVTELARRLQQAFAVDAEHAVWSFGNVPVTRNAFLQSAVAPDFALPNREGKMVRLSDFRGKKVLVITWASW